MLGPLGGGYYLSAGVRNTGVLTLRSTGRCNGRRFPPNRFDLALVYSELGRHRHVVAMQRDSIRRYVRAGAWFFASAMATGSFRALVALDEHRAAGLIVGACRASFPMPAVYEDSIPAPLEAQLESEVGAAELARPVELGGHRTVEANVAEVLAALDRLSA